MSAFLPNLELAFGWLLAASWQASVLALAVIAIQRIFGARLNPRWRYALWLLVVLRLVLPILPESALSLFQFAPPPPAALTVSVSEPLFVDTPTLPQGDVPAIGAVPSRPFSLYSLLAIIWLAGAIGLSALTVIVNRRFARQVANSPEIADPELLRLFSVAKEEFRVRRPIRLVESGQVQSPAIMGLFHPTLLLPVDVREKFDARELRFIFLHELAHLKRGDVLVQVLIALLQILHWFNPVLWFAFRRMRIDREPATDALVLSRTGEDEKERYGLMLIKLLEHFNQRHSLATLVGILEDKDQFKRRFSLIARFTGSAYGWSLLGVLIIGLLSMAFLTKSKASATTIVSTTQPATDATGKNPAVMIRLNLKVVQIDDDDYMAHRAEVDSAVLKGDTQPLLFLKSYHLVMEDPILTKSGEQGVIENVRVMPFTAAPRKDSNGNILPIENKKRNLGVRFVNTPSFSNGKVNVKGHLEVTRLSGWIPREGNYHEPFFNETLRTISDTFTPGQTRGYEATKGALIAYSDPYFYFTSDNPPASSKNSQIGRRIFFFLKAEAFHDDGSSMTVQPVDSATQRTDAAIQNDTKEATESAHIQVLAIDLPESDYQADRPKIDDLVRNGYFTSLLRLPHARELARSALARRPLVMVPGSSRARLNPC